MDKVFREIEQDEKSTDSLDSDDPECWGPYYWSQNDSESDLNIVRKAKDNLKFASFKTYRSNAYLFSYV